MARRSIKGALRDRHDWLDHQATGKLNVRQKALEDLEDAASTEDRTRTDYSGRYPIELLQNAHDACADAGVRGIVTFAVTKSALIVANEGRPFDATRILSLVRQGSSEKALRISRNTIGYKGIGFSSVFEVTDRPQIISAGEARFEFDRAKARKLVATTLKLRPRAVAARAFPFPIGPEAWEADSQIIHSLSQGGAATIIRLPLRKGIKAAEVAATLRAALKPEVLLFMEAVERLELRLLGDETIWSRRRGSRSGNATVVHLDENGQSLRSWLVARDKVPISAQQARSLQDPAWRDVRKADVMVGLPWSRGVSERSSSDPVHVYFPTEERLGRSVLVHADFVVDSRRAAITLKGSAGALNERLAQAAADLLAKTAEAHAARHARAVCSALARHETSTEFGEYLGGRLVDALKKRRLVIAFGAKGPVKVSSAKRATDLTPEWDTRILKLLGRKQSVVEPKILGGRAQDLLEELGLTSLETDALVRRLAIPKTVKRYETALATVHEWLHELSYNDRRLAIEELRDRPVLLDRGGHFRKPSETVLSVAHITRLPAPLAKHSLRQVADPAAADLFDDLDIEHLDDAGALQVLISAIDERRYGRNGREHRVVLRFLRDMWQHNRSVLIAAGTEELSIARVPVRSAKGRDKAWVEASKVYFGHEWNELGARVEAAYGPLGIAEFLDALVPAKPQSRGRELTFYRTLGVATEPRSVPLTEDYPRYDQWRALEETRAAFVCPDDHSSSYMEIVRGGVMDRLEPLLERARSDGAHSLANLLAALDGPYGDPAEVRCTHKAHRWNRKTRPTEGYQRWRLRTTSWVPVRNDPEGRRRRPPTEVWADVPARRPPLVPTANLGTTTPALELVPWTGPPASAVESTLRLLPKSEQDPARVAETADQILKKLEASLTRDSPIRDCPSLLCTIGKQRKWSDHPVIPDLPRLERLDDLATLPLGSWENIRRVYGLPLASSLVEQSLTAGPRRSDLLPLLPHKRKARLLAVLTRGRSAATSDIATRLKRIREHPVRDFDLQLQMNGKKRHIRNLALHLIEKPRKKRQLPLADLYFTPDATADSSELATLLRLYLATKDYDRLWFALTAPDSALAEEGIGPAEIAEASELLAKRRSPPPTSPQQAVEDEYRDALQEPDGFGASETPEAPADRGRNGGVPKDIELPAPKAADLKFGSPERLPNRPLPYRVDPANDGTAADPPRDDRTSEPLEHSSQGATQQGRAAGTNQVDSESEANRAGVAFGGAPSDSDSGPDRAVEQRAVEYAWEYGRRELGAEVRDVQSLKLGWDLEFHLPDGTDLLIEVKGSSGSSGFAITRNELDKARKLDNWQLYYAHNLGSATPSLVRITGFDAIQDGALIVEQYRVPSWRSLDCEEIPITATDGRAVKA